MSHLYDYLSALAKQIFNPEPPYKPGERSFEENVQEAQEASEQRDIFTERSRMQQAFDEADREQENPSSNDTNRGEDSGGSRSSDSGHESNSAGSESGFNNGSIDDSSGMSNNDGSDTY